MKTTRELISEELRSIRAKKKLTIESVAEQSGVNKDTISRYENNLVSMQIDILEKLLNFYDIDFSIFFTNVYANKHNKVMG
ncbi:MAG: helix-turn-helix transcriptional regulator [Bacilli bacterium]|nr:helix-turn-helix transcriptional regulator [Bacilli bacterium]